jgi:hypothetical protein
MAALEYSISSAGTQWCRQRAHHDPHAGHVGGEITTMTKIRTSDLPPSDSISPACIKYYQPLAKKNKKKSMIDTDAIGTPAYNTFLDLLRCQAKHPNMDEGSNPSEMRDPKKKCLNVEKNYSSCHAAVMGIGNYKGRKNCGEEIEQFYRCANPESSSP